MSQPTSTDLILALAVRDLAAKRMHYDESDGINRDFDDYVREVSDEILGIWRTISDHMAPKD